MCARAGVRRLESGQSRNGSGQQPGAGGVHASRPHQACVVDLLQCQPIIGSASERSREAVALRLRDRRSKLAGRAPECDDWHRHYGHAGAWCGLFRCVLEATKCVQACSSEPACECVSACECTWTCVHTHGVCIFVHESAHVCTSVFPCESSEAG